MWRALAAIGDEIPDEVRVVVVRGRGQSFSAGLDRAHARPGRPATASSRWRGCSRCPTRDRGDHRRLPAGFTWLRDPRFVSVAVVQGHAIGAGFQLALSCDLRVVGEDAQFCMKESALGLVPDLTGTKPLVESVGYARALEICATARMVGADEAVGDRAGDCRRTRRRARRDGGGPGAGADRALPGAVTRDQGAAAGRGRADLEEQRRLEREAQVRRFRELAPDGPQPGRTESGGADVRHARSMRPRRGATCAPTARVVNNRIDRRTVRRVFGFAAPAPRADRGVPGAHRHRRRAGGRHSAAGEADRRRRHPPATTGAGHLAGARHGRRRGRRARCSAWSSGWLSSRIGEGLIYDLRTQVFGHVQRQSLAFFTRTQTGALVSPAQQRRDRRPARLHLDPVRHRRPTSISVVVVGITMLALSWQVTLLCLALFPLLLLASRWVSGRLAGLTREQMDGNADLGNVMTERFNVGGAMLLKLFGRRGRGGRAVRRPRPRRVRDLGVRISLITRVFVAAMMMVPALATALVYGVGGHLAVSGALTVGTVIALGHPAAAPARPAPGPLQRAHRRDDRPGQLRAGLRGARPAARWSQEKPDAVAVPAGASRLVFDKVAFTYPRADEISLASLEAVARAESRDRGAVLKDVSFVAEPGQMVALVGPSGAGKTTVTNLVARLYDVRSGAVRVGGLDVRDVTLQSLEDRSATSRRTPTCSTTRSAPTCSTPGPTPTRSRSGTRCAPRRSSRWCATARRPRHRGRRPRLPAVRR